MKNLRKVLALVLVVASLMGMAVMTNAAVDFDDAAKISTANTMAVDILQTLKVINGKTATTFDPQGNVTRAEMAKMITFIMNGGNDVGNLYKDSCTFADSKNHWAAGYIGYCATMGIINGRSETVFAPQDNVTGTEAAKMMLCALGYDAGNKGLTGTNWAGNTLKLASEKGLFTKVLTAPNQALTREAAAQLLWNGMQNKTISYSGASTIVVGGVTVVQGGTETESTNTLMAQKFAGVTAVNDDYHDEWHRPGVSFTINGETSTYLDAPIITNYGPLKVSEIQKIVGINGADLLANGVTTRVWTGGFDQTSTNCSPYFWNVVGGKKDATTYGGLTVAKATSNYTGMTATSTASVGSNGDYVEVYWNAGAKELDVIIFWSDPVKVSAWSQNSTTKDITVTLDQEFGGSYFHGTEGNPVQFVFKADETAITKETTYAIGYRAKLNPSDSAYAPFTVIAPQVATVTSAGFASKAGKATTLYTAEKNYTVDNSGVFNAFAVGYDYNLYMDPAGIVFYAESKQDIVETKYLYLIDTAIEGTTFGDNTYLAKVLFADGTVEVVETNVDYNKAAGLYTYTTDKEVYTLTSVMATADTTKNIANKGAAFGSYFFNNKTLFVVETTVGSDKVYSTYTGINNVPTLTGDIYFAVNADNASLIDVVFVMGATESGETAATELDVSVLFASTGVHTLTTKPGADGKSHSYYTINAIINGAVTTVKVSPEVFNAIKCSNSHSHSQANCEAKAEAFTYIDSYKIDANGVIYELTETTALTAASMTAMAGTSATSKLYKDGVIKIGGVVVAIEADVPAYVYDKDGNAFEIKTIANLTKSFSGFVLKNTAGDILAFYGIDNKV